METHDIFTGAVRLHHAGRLAEAEALYRAILAADPGHAGSLHRLGVIAIQQRDYDGAVALIGRAIAADPQGSTATYHNSIAVALRRSIRLAEAAEHYRHVVRLKPDSADAHVNLGAVLKDCGQSDEAMALYRRALILRPDYAEAHYNLGLVHRARNRPDDAIASYQRAIALQPNYTPAFANLGVLLKEQGRLEEAAACFRQALSLDPDSPLLYNNLAIVLKEQGKRDNAAVCCRRALELDPTNAPAYNTLGLLFKDMDRLDHAATCCRKALEMACDYPEALYNLGAISKDLGAADDAIACYERLLALDPRSARARVALCMAQLPPLYRTEAEIGERRSAYERELYRLDDEAGDLADAVGSSQPFYLAYQGQNDRDLQSIYGGLVCRAMAARYPAAPMAKPAQPGERIRIGIVSGYFRRHANWNLPIHGWLSRLDRSKFQLFAYHTGTERDTQTDIAARLCERFVQGPLSTEGWRAAILADAPHVLIYPEIGMDPMASRLAAQRLASIQCNSWGHPVTSGFPTIDYYLSSDLMEPPDAQAHYSEQLVRLPNLSVYVPAAAPAAVTVTRVELGLRVDAPVYWCGQSLQKYLPRYDDVFPRIAQSAGPCQFVFIEFPGSPNLTALFRTRLRLAFAGFGLNADEYCLVLPRLDPDRFAAAMGLGDIVLDSIGWSGCNSLLDSLPYDLPIVTMTGSLMRGRHGTAILQRMGVTETIAATRDDYVSVAARLALDADWREAVRRKMAAGKSGLYQDEACIAALENFLLDAASNASSPD